MDASQPQTTHRHPFTAALANRDRDALLETLAPDVRLHAAVTRTPFEGRAIVGELYASVIESFERLEIVDELERGDTHAFFWRGQIEGRFVEGADRFRLDRTGKVSEITIFGRPLSGLATFVTGIGVRFARRRRGPLVARILGLTARPLPPMLASLDLVTRWLARGKQAES